ncbi:hypothetical protein 3 [Beihai sipunculid worm virus 5]|uniref:hypothetical protein 3 n=1 Tax=Beihai sipunculid worm virus 5 TaxID=1922677 RepID=UPI00090A8AE1|nr:hypothetical protein 3 [Beihai sipunculid worm virus 5]APG76867.1 hypothetical protein 3 [Beihai sipunculid worm virus 5]
MAAAAAETVTTASAGSAGGFAGISGGNIVSSGIKAAGDVITQSVKDKNEWDRLNLSINYNREQNQLNRAYNLKLVDKQQSNALALQDDKYLQEALLYQKEAAVDLTNKEELNKQVLGLNISQDEWKMKQFEKAGLPGIFALGGGSQNLPQRKQYLGGGGPSSYRTTADIKQSGFSSTAAQNYYGAGDLFITPKKRGMNYVLT